jgi:phosphotransferase system enzyme I (PtsI)
MARRELRGEGTARGAALGVARIRYPLDFSADPAPVARHEIPREIERIEAAIGRARGELDAVRRRLRGPLRREIGEFVDAHALILDDPEFAAGIRAGIVERRLNAEAALKAHRDQLLAAFEAIDDPYLRSRGEDVEQVVGRGCAALKRGRAEPRRAHAPGGVVLVAESVAPDEIEGWRQQGLAALIVTRASVWSHATILARALRLPMLVVAGDVFDLLRDGDPVLVDADAGIAIAEPDALDLARWRERQRASERSSRARSRLRTSETQTRDGLAIRLWANAEKTEDIAAARRLGAVGIGLFRTEFLLASPDVAADEDAQFRVYRDAVLAMGGRPVTLRTLDVGADKGAAAVAENPALGLRGLRLSLARPAAFAAQLRAMLRASAYGPVRILFPMVTSLDEAERALAIVDACRAELTLSGIRTGEVLIGGMVEVPGAALIADRLARAFDFLALGSNDLVQYTLAADRNDAAVATCYDPLHPAVLRLLALTLDHARRARRALTLCGELAGDPRATALLVGLGFTDLSVHPNVLLEVREQVLGLHAAALRKRVRRLVAAGEARTLLDEGDRR